MNKIPLLKLLNRYVISYFNQNRRINEFDINLFLRQFSTLFSAGIPLIKCFEVLEKSQTKNSLRLLIYSIKRELLSGKDLYSSLHPYPRYFDEMTCQLIKIGEHTGKLEMMLTKLANEKEKYLLFKRQLIKSLSYPLIISITAVIVTLCMFLIIIPRFAELFSNSNIQLPLITIWIFYLSQQLQQHIFIIFLPLIFILLILPHPLSIKLRKKFLHRIFHLPILNSFIKKMLLARFARNLAMTYQSGMPVTDALKLIMYTDANLEFTLNIMMLRNKINSGLQLHQAMELIPCFPDMMVQMVKIGEESGMIEHLLNKVADIFESDVNQLVSQVGQLVEPLIMLLQGVLIGGLVISMYLPIFKLGNLF